MYWVRFQRHSFSQLSDLPLMYASLWRVDHPVQRSGVWWKKAQQKNIKLAKSMQFERRPLRHQCTMLRTDLRRQSPNQPQTRQNFTWYFFSTARLPRWFDQPIQSVSFAAIIHTPSFCQFRRTTWTLLLVFSLLLLRDFGTLFHWTVELL